MADKPSFEIGDVIADDLLPPPRSLETFMRQIPGNKDFSFAPRGKFQSLEETLGAYEDLPEPVRKVIDKIRTAETTAEKAAIAHSFAVAYIKPELQADLPGEKIPFVDFAKNPRGDCDDYKRFMAGLLSHGGVDPHDIFLVGGLMKYTVGQFSLPAPHAFVVVKDGDEYLLLDNNLEGIPVIDPKNPRVSSTSADAKGLSLPGLDPSAPMHAEIMFLSHGEDGRGNNFEDPKLQAEKVKQAKQIDDMILKVEQMLKNGSLPGQPGLEGFGESTAAAQKPKSLPAP
ncbi:MAG: hypothetical protein KA155_01845 [Alphaproteobacteria bacterium]|jgi:hypothetical protein|nr:hypothetical protein [Alphaproteobacteria bacterium]